MWAWSMDLRSRRGEWDKPHDPTGSGVPDTMASSQPPLHAGHGGPERCPITPRIPRPRTPAGVPRPTACATIAAVLVVLNSVVALFRILRRASCDESPYSGDSMTSEDAIGGPLALDPTMLGTADPVATGTASSERSSTSTSSYASGESTEGDVNLKQMSFAAEGVDFDPDLSPDGAWMVFASTQHHERPNLYRKSVTGQVVTQLTSDPSRNVMPEISPDGRRIAFASDRSGNWDVFVMDSAGGPAVQITFDRAQEIHPTWSPDGSRLCYCRHNPVNDQWALWTPRSSTRRALLRLRECSAMVARRAEDRILFQRSRKRGERLYGIWTIDLVDGDGVNPTEVVASGGSATMHPTWSPSGDRIAYAAVPQPSYTVDGMPVWSDICVVDVDGTDRTTLTAGGFRNLRPTWGPDEEVFFMSNRSGRNVIWAISATDGGSGFDRMAETESPDANPAAYATVAPLAEGD